MKRIFLTALLLCSTVCLLLACGVKDACADGHSFTSYVSNGDATCTDDGTKTAKCERCGTSETVTDEGSAGHLFGEWVLSASGGAGCDTKLYFRVCDACRDIEWKQGSYDDHSWSVITVNPTCQMRGYDEKICTSCGALEKINYTDTVDHLFENYVSNNNATCTADGTKTSKCNWCDVTDTVVEIGSIGHSFTSYVYNRDATCTADGTKTAKCNRCNATDTVVAEGTKLSHSYGDYVSDGNATCTADGTKTAKCAYCDATYTVADEGSKLAHSFGEYLHDGEYHWQKCGVCEALGEKGGHGDDQSRCSICNRLIYTEGLVFELDLYTDYKKYAVADYIGTEEEIVIPKTYKGKSVSRVWGINENSNITSVIISEGITEISGFFWCPNLKTVIIPEGVTRIGYETFRGCNSLENVSIPNSVTNIGNEVFSECYALKCNEYENGYYIGNDINPYMVLIRVDNCDNKTFKIHRDTKFVFDIPTGDALENIIVPDGILYFTGVWLEGCPSLKCNFYQNAWYLGNEINPYVVLLESTSDDITSAVIHNDTKVICSYAFSDCVGLEKIIIPKGVVGMGEMVFYDCVNLTIYCESLSKPDTWKDHWFEDPLHSCPVIWGYMSYKDYVAADINSFVVVEAYIQDKQSWWFDSKAGYGKGTFYLQDSSGGAYFLYELKCTEEEYNALAIGTRVQLQGYKAEWNGEVEIIDATYTIIPYATYIAQAFDITDKLDDESLIDYQNRKVAFKGMTVSGEFMYGWNGAGSEGADLYFKADYEGKTYTFVVESYLRGADTDVYKAVKALKVGDVIDMEGFLYWYEGAQPHITSVYTYWDPNGWT